VELGHLLGLMCSWERGLVLGLRWIVELGRLVMLV